MVKVSPTRPSGGRSWTARSMSEPSSAGWFAGAASKRKISVAGAAICREDETPKRLSLSMPPSHLLEAPGLIASLGWAIILETGEHHHSHRRMQVAYQIGHSTTSHPS